MEKLESAFVVLFLVTLATRILPLFLSNFLNRFSQMKHLAAQLPCMILILLIINDIKGHYAGSTIGLLASIVGLLMALIVHYLKKQTILSIACGVITFALLSLL